MRIHRGEMLGQHPSAISGKPPLPLCLIAPHLQSPMHCYENQCHGRTARIPILSYAARNPISIRHELRTSLRLRSSPDRFNNTQLDEASIDRASQPALQSKELELLGKPTALVHNQVQDDSKRGAGDAVSAPYLDYFSSRATPGEELDEWEPIKEVQTGEQDVEVQFYEPKVGDLVVGVVVSGNANRLDINIGSDVLATMLSKEVLPLYDAEMERLLCEIPRESNAEAEGSLFAPGKMGIVRNEEALSPGPGPGRPVVEMGTVLSAEVLGRTLSGKPLLSSRRFSRRIAWHRVRQIKQLNEPIDVHILEWNTGGLITRIEGLRAFLPKTELVNKPFDNFAALKANLGRQTSVLISRVDEANGELVVSEREAWDRKYLCEGTLLEGTIRRLFSYGAQVRVDGTSVSAAMGIFDAMQLCRADISTVAFGIAASTASIVLTGGSKGKRLAMPNARIMMHQPLGGASGQAIDVEIQAKEIMYHKTNVTRIISESTGRPFEEVEKDIDRDRYMSPMEAVEYGLIDGVIDRDSIIPLSPLPERVKPRLNFEEASKDPRKFLTPDIPDDEIY